MYNKSFLQAHLQIYRQWFIKNVKLKVWLLYLNDGGILLIK